MWLVPHTNEQISRKRNVFYRLNSVGYPDVLSDLTSDPQRIRKSYWMHLQTTLTNLHDRLYLDHDFDLFLDHDRHDFHDPHAWHHVGPPPECFGWPPEPGQRDPL